MTNKLTKEEALKKVRGYLTDYLPLEDADEIDEIIEALEPSVTPSYNSIKTELKPCEDCISREEAIRIAEQGQIQGYEWQFKKLCNLPSVTPSIPDVENNFNLGYNCGYADAMSDIAESEVQYE